MESILAAGSFLVASGETYTRILGLDPQLIHDAVLLGVNIFILFFALSYLLFNPARAMLEKRTEKIRADLDGAAKEKESAEGLKTEYEAKLKDIDKEAEAKKRSWSRQRRNPRALSREPAARRSLKRRRLLTR